MLHLLSAQQNITRLTTLKPPKPVTIKWDPTRIEGKLLSYDGQSPTRSVQNGQQYSDAHQFNLSFKDLETETEYETKWEVRLSLTSTHSDHTIKLFIHREPWVDGSDNGGGVVNTGCVWGYEGDVLFNVELLDDCQLIPSYWLDKKHIHDTILDYEGRSQSKVMANVEKVGVGWTMEFPSCYRYPHPHFYTSLFQMLVSLKLSVEQVFEPRLLTLSSEPRSPEGLTELDESHDKRELVVDTIRKLESFLATLSMEEKTLVEGSVSSSAQEQETLCQDLKRKRMVEVETDDPTQVPVELPLGEEDADFLFQHLQSPTPFGQDNNGGTDSALLTTTCHMCGYPASTKHKLSDHMKRKHSSEPRPWQCRYSGCKNNVGFLEESGLKRHIVDVHERIRPFTCTVGVCRNSFSSAKDLKRHSIVHMRLTTMTVGAPKISKSRTRTRSDL